VKIGNLIRAFISVAFLSAAAFSPAQTTAPRPTAPSLEQRVADLEAYLNNSARGADAANAAISSNVSGPGPGHNAWMMTASALVLFMTLPGLALFYGGLVRAPQPPPSRPVTAGCVAAQQAQCSGPAPAVGDLG
jgi:ammonium transporter, Amt family